MYYCIFRGRDHSSTLSYCFPWRCSPESSKIQSRLTKELFLQVYLCMSTPRPPRTHSLSGYILSNFCTPPSVYMCIDMGTIMDFKCSVENSLFPKGHWNTLLYESISVSCILSLVEFKGNFPIVRTLLNVPLHYQRKTYYLLMFLNTLLLSW